MKKLGKMIAVMLCAALLVSTAAPAAYAASVNVNVGPLFGNQGSKDDENKEDPKEDDKKDDSKDDNKEDGSGSTSGSTGGSSGGSTGGSSGGSSRPSGGGSSGGSSRPSGGGSSSGSGSSGSTGSSDTKTDDTKKEDSKADETKPEDTKTDETAKNDTKTDEPKQEIVYPTFTDVNEADWFYGDVRELSGMKVINGYEDGSYKPENAVTRAEFLKLLVTLLCDEMFTPDGAMFKDVPGDEWYTKYVASAIVYGFVDMKDYGDTFGPDEAITRREVAKIVTRALQVESGKYQTPYADTADQNIVALYGLCLMQGSIDPATGERLFYPDTEITRAETAAVILRIFKLVTNADEYIKSFKETHDVPDLKLLYTPLAKDEFYNEFTNAWESSQAFLMYTYPYAAHGEEMREILEECYAGF